MGRVIREILRKDLCALYPFSHSQVAYSRYPVFFSKVKSHAAFLKLRFPWATWLNYAFRERLRLLGWPAEAPRIPGPGCQLEKIPISVIRTANDQRRDFDRGTCPSANVYKVLQVVSWTDGE